MVYQATAIYEGGVLRLLTPLALPEHSRVRVHVEPRPALDEPHAHDRQVAEALLAAGLILAAMNRPAAVSAISPERLEELARPFFAGCPLSEIIAEERDGL